MALKAYQNTEFEEKLHIDQLIKALEKLSPGRGHYVVTGLSIL